MCEIINPLLRSLKKYYIRHRSEIRVELEKKLQLFSHLGIFGAIGYDTGYAEHWEWHAGAEIPVSRYFSLFGQYHSEFGVGGGLMVRY